MALLTHWDGEPVQVWESLWHAPLVEAHDLLGSTNDRARALAEEGAGPFTVVVADEQTAGRGRSGSTWHSAAGAGLWISALLPGDRGVPAYLPLLVGLAVARAVEGAAGDLQAGIKWPNDVEVAGRKVAGVLCERGPELVVVGVGVNVSQRPEDFPAGVADRATSLEVAAGRRVSLGSLATAFMAGLHELCSPPSGLVSERVHEELVRRDTLRGRTVVTQQVGSGVARGITREGALVVECSDGCHRPVVAGSVRVIPGGQ